MTRTTNARLAGFTFLFYIAAGILAMNLFPGGNGITERFEGIVRDLTNVRISIILSLLTSFAAITLAVTLRALTREQDPDLAMLALICRVGEGIIGGVGLLGTLALVWLATADGAGAPDPDTAGAIGTILLKASTWTTIICAFFFAVGSTIFCWLFLRARSIPLWMARLGVAASVLLVALLPVQFFGGLGGIIGWLVWMPMLVFELVLAFWLITKGVAAPASRKVAL